MLRKTLIFLHASKSQKQKTNIEALQQIEGVWGVFVREGEAATLRAVRKGPELVGDVMVLDGVAPGESAELRAVRKGPELGGAVMVLDGVVPGELVATDGAYLLKALWLKRAGGGEGHDH